MKFSINQKVKIKQQIWGKPNPPVGVIVGTFKLNTNKFDSEARLECSVRDSHLTDYGYDVFWEHNKTSNPWTEIELESI
jgi:hypothetical protein